MKLLFVRSIDVIRFYREETKIKTSAYESTLEQIECFTNFAFTSMRTGHGVRLKKVFIT